MLLNLPVLMAILCTQEPKTAFIVKFAHRHGACRHWLSIIALRAEKTYRGFLTQFLHLLLRGFSMHVFNVVFGRLFVDAVHRLLSDNDFKKRTVARFKVHIHHMKAS